MRAHKFRHWLTNVYVQGNGGGLAYSTIDSRVGNCHTIERYEGDLDDLFRMDEMHSLLSELYPLAPKHKIPINGDIYNGTATLKAAAKLYQSFCNWDMQ